MSRYLSNQELIDLIRSGFDFFVMVGELCIGGE